MSVSSDCKDLLKLFNDYQVKYLIIGGYAVIKYTEPRLQRTLICGFGPMLKTQWPSSGRYESLAHR